MVRVCLASQLDQHYLTRPIFQDAEYFRGRECSDPPKPSFSAWANPPLHQRILICDETSLPGMLVREYPDPYDEKQLGQDIECTARVSVLGQRLPHQALAELP